MNQHISVEQAKEIYPQMTGYLASIGLAPKGYTALAEWLTIGRMIELLESKDQCLNVDKRTDLEGWGYEIRLRQLDYWNFSTGELVDALFMAVKEVLK